MLRATSVRNMFWFALIQFVNCKDELLRLLEAYVKILGDKILPYAVEIKVHSA